MTAPQGPEDDPAGDPVDPVGPAGTSGGDPPVADEHRDDGTDLATVIARGLAGRTRRPAAGRRRSGDPGSGAWSASLVRRTGGPRYSGAHADDRDPQPMAASVERLVVDQGWGTELRVHGVFSRWSAIVGAEVASHATPESYVEGRLVVRTDSTAWATQLSLMAAALVKRIDDELGDQTVRVVEVVGPRGPSWRKGRLRVRGRGPRDTYG